MILVTNKKNRVPSLEIIEHHILKSAASRPIDIDNCNFGPKTWVTIHLMTVSRSLIFLVDLSAIKKRSKITLGRCAKK
jgi:hypothetical protein